jgi:hypothetical protein
MIGHWMIGHAMVMIGVKVHCPDNERSQVSWAALQRDDGQHCSGMMGSTAAG